MTTNEETKRDLLALAEAAIEQLVDQLEEVKMELDGVMARLRRGSVPMDKQESEREGDVYREVKVGAAFVGEPGSERSELVPGVFVDVPGPKRYVARRTTAEEFGPLLYALARQAGLLRAQQVVILGDGAKWIWNLADEHFPGAVQIVDEYHAREHWLYARLFSASSLRNAGKRPTRELDRGLQIFPTPPPGS